LKKLRKPTREQRKLIEKYNLNSSDWLIERDTPEEIVLIHRYSDTTRKTIYKEWK
jgi:hypothetical protein